MKIPHSDSTCSLPLHYAAAHDNMTALEIVYSVHKDGVNHVDEQGLQPFHVAADSDSVEAVKFLYDETTEQHKSSLSKYKEEILTLEQAIANITKFSYSNLLHLLVISITLKSLNILPAYHLA